MKRAARHLATPAHVALALLVALICIAVGRPITSDDVWWHLALGRAYAAEGPWLDADPLLFTATGPPAPAAWLFDLLLHGTFQAAGFSGLRVLHVVAVLSILACAFRLFARSSGTAAIASAGTAAFAGLAAYRLFQLRPELMSMLATFALLHFVIAGDRSPLRRALLAAGLLALWANLHAAFLLGPILMAGALAGCVAAACVAPPDARLPLVARARGLACALAAGVAASLLTPGGTQPFEGLLAAGSASPSLSLVADEWVAFSPFTLPNLDTPPSPLAWMLLWLQLTATPLLTLLALQRCRRGGAEAAELASLAGLACAALLLELYAVRFLWLSLFPILLLSALVRIEGPALRHVVGTRVASVAASLALLVGFVWLGDWPFLSKGLPRSPGGYAAPYAGHKYHAHALRFLSDAGLEGRVFADYYMGGFLGFWLAPKLQTFVNGTLNVSPDVADDYVAIRRMISESGTPAEQILERWDVDLFVGIGMPIAPSPHRPWRYTTSHLEREPGFSLVFRNLRSAVYLRARGPDDANLLRVRRWYEEVGVPFDPARGFDTGRVIEARPDWAIERGIVPEDYEQLRSASRRAGGPARRDALDRLASLHAALGLYASCLSLDAELLARAPRHEGALRRRVWCAIRADRPDEALEASRALLALAPHSPLGQQVAQVAGHYASSPPILKKALSALLPVFEPGQAQALTRGYREAASLPLTP